VINSLKNAGCSELLIAGVQYYAFASEEPIGRALSAARHSSHAHGEGLDVRTMEETYRRQTIIDQMPRSQRRVQRLPRQRHGLAKADTDSARPRPAARCRRERESIGYVPLTGAVGR